jgi:hypothetical protein
MVVSCIARLLGSRTEWCPCGCRPPWMNYKATYPTRSPCGLLFLRPRPRRAIYVGQWWEELLPACYYHQQHAVHPPHRMLPQTGWRPAASRTPPARSVDRLVRVAPSRTRPGRRGQKNGRPRARGRSARMHGACMHALARQPPKQWGAAGKSGGVIHSCMIST